MTWYQFEGHRVDLSTSDWAPPAWLHVWQTNVSSHTLVSLQPDDSSLDLLCEGGRAPARPLLGPHSIKHWCGSKVRLEPVSYCGLAFAYSKFLLWLQPVSFQFLSLPVWCISLLLLWLFECGRTELLRCSECCSVERRHIKSHEMRVITVCYCLWPLAQRWDVTSWKWLCVCIWFLYSMCDAVMLCIQTYHRARL